MILDFKVFGRNLCLAPKMAASSSKVKPVPAARRARHSPYPMLDLDEAFALITSQAKIHFDQIKDSIIMEKTISELSDTHERVHLASSVTARRALPPFRASVKDGYAVLAEDGQGPRSVLRESQCAPSDYLGTCCQVNTGCKVPNQYDAVVQIEDTRILQTDAAGNELTIEILSTPKAGQDIRPVGCDIPEGEVLPLEPGQPIDSVQLGLCASSGVTSLQVFKQPTIGVLSTGDELKDISQHDSETDKSAIFDSNRLMLKSFLRRKGFSSIVDLGIAKDSPDAILEAMSKGFDKHNVDVLITTGGVSMGDKDFMKQILTVDLDATIHFGRVNMKPGKPTTFATGKGSKRPFAVFALPGNPVSAFVTATLFVLPYLDVLMGSKIQAIWDAHRCIAAPLKLYREVRLDTRPEFMRIHLDADGVARPLSGGQQSSRLASVAQADGIALLPSAENVPDKCISSLDSVKIILL